MESIIVDDSGRVSRFKSEANLKNLIDSLDEDDE